MKFWYFLYIWLAIIKCSQSLKKENNLSDRFRLSKTVIPNHYTLKIKTILEENNFKHISSVKIQFYCIAPTNKITLHSRNLEIKSVKLILISDALSEMEKETDKLVEKHELEPEYDFLHIYSNNNLVENVWYVLEIHFTGEISNGMTGYYRSSYKDEAGQKQWIATTQFEPTNARKAFPCFDEPALRARFTIHLGHQAHFTALSNMPLKYTREDENGWVWDIFEETLNMPTYLVAFTINDFGFKTTLKSNRYGNTTLNVWAPKKSLKQVKFATKVAPKILSFFEEFFDIAFPISKSDLLAVPDFAAGAMENWGLITFKESKLLYLAGVSTDSDKLGIAKTMAHEIAHYWFGDLVTIKWWSYLWLKEGFATYLARIAVGHLFPKWESRFNGILIEDMQAVYGVDALQASRSVSVTITDPNTIHEIFDTITYNKGSCVIRMMELFLGNEVLRKGLIHYLNKYKYGSTEPNDLWNSLTIVAHEEKSLSEELTVNEIMDTWTEQPGFPLVTVVRDYNKGTVTVKQRRFLENKEKQDDSCYWIPLTYTTMEETDFNNAKLRKWLPCPKQSITFELDNSYSWILFNVQATGLYRVNYDHTNWKMLITQLETNHTRISKLNRVLLIDDVIKLAINDYLDFKIAFDLVKYVRHDDEYAIWSKALQNLLAIAHLLEHTPHYELIQNFMRNLVIPQYQNFGGINGLKQFSSLQSRIVSAACELGNRDCEEDAVNIYKQWKQSSGNYKFPRSMRHIVFCQGVKHGDEEEWNYLWQHYLQSNLATEKASILPALACTKKQWLLERYLNMIIEKDSGIRHQYAHNVVAYVINNKVGSNIARSFFYKNVKELYNIQSPKGKRMKVFLMMVANTLRSEEEIIEYKTFLKENEKYLKMARLTSNQMLERLVIWKQWYKNMYFKVVHALEQQLQIMESSSSGTCSKRIKLH